MDVKLFFNKRNLKIRIAVTVMNQYNFKTQIPVMNEFPNLTSKNQVKPQEKQNIPMLTKQ